MLSCAGNRRFAGPLVVFVMRAATASGLCQDLRLLLRPTWRPGNRDLPVRLKQALVPDHILSSGKRGIA
jgi:hypothetical protein